MCNTISKTKQAKLANAQNLSKSISFPPHFTFSTKSVRMKKKKENKRTGNNHNKEVRNRVAKKKEHIKTNETNHTDTDKQNRIHRISASI